MNEKEWLLGKRTVEQLMYCLDCRRYWPHEPAAGDEYIEYWSKEVLKRVTLFASNPEGW